MSRPTISVALCTYNGARYLPTQLRSIAEQTLLPSEIVVSDDGSTDGTATVIQKFARQAPFPVRFSQQALNLGVTQNFGAALALCQSEIIALCDQDDIWLPQKLQVCTEFLEAHPECLAVFTDATVVDESLQPLAPDDSLWQRVYLTPDVLARLRTPDSSLPTLTHCFYVTGATMVIRRELLRYALPIPSVLPKHMIHDGWLSILAAATGRLNFLAQRTILYRQHPGQQVGLNEPFAGGKTLFAPRDAFLPTAERLELLHAMLHARVADKAQPGVLEKMRGEAAHVRFRGELSRSRARRLIPILAEILRGGYFRFSRRPFFAPLRDMIL